MNNSPQMPAENNSGVRGSRGHHLKRERKDFDLGENIAKIIRMVQRKG